MANGDSEKFIEQLQELLKDRERAQKGIASLVMEKEKLEAERDELKAALFKAGEERAGIVVDTGALIEQMADLKEKERARSVIIDAQTKRATEAEKRVDILEKILARIEGELYSAIEEEDDFLPLKELAKEFDADLDLDRADRLQAQEDGSISELPIRVIQHKEIKARLIGSRCAVIRTLAVVVSAPFLLMASLFALASQGIYVQVFYDLMDGSWQPWMGSDTMKALSIGVPLLLFGLWYGLCYKAAVIPSEEEKAPPKDDGPETDEMGKALDEIFGDPVDEATGTGQQ